MHTLRHRTAREWFKALRHIKDKPLRIQTANIVWYDLICDRHKQCRMWSAYISAWKPEFAFDWTNVEQALLLVGYTEQRAKIRGTECQNS